MKEWCADKYFEINPTDFDGLCKIMDRHSEFDTLLVGVNEFNEDTLIGVYEDNISVLTYQDNGWTRLNVYWRDGTTEETFGERWK